MSIRPGVVADKGAGQTEVEVAGAADTTMVVLNPGWGDALQASKAGLLEAADIFVINKADRAGVGETQRDLEFMLHLSSSPDGWTPPIIRTVATTGEGTDQVWDALARHRAFLDDARAVGDEQEHGIRSMRLQAPDEAQEADS